MRGDLHTHTTYCDGKNTPKEMVEAAMNRGDRYIGFSGHGYTRFDESYCMSKEGQRAYFQEIQALKQKYGDRIRIFLGVEKDYYSGETTSKFDYVIGSVHYMRFGNEYVDVDNTPEILRYAADRYCNGDMYKVCEAYYKNVGDVVEKTGCDIIGHFDLISKFIETDKLFDPKNPRYVKAWKEAVDKLVPYGIPFEINTGAMSRGYRMTPYPSSEIRDYIREKGGKFVLTGDSHSAETLCYAFEKYESEAIEPDFVR